MSVLKISDHIVALRHKKGITQEELAAFLGVTKASVSKWETKQSYPDILLLPQIAAFFDVSIDSLMGYEPQLSPEQIKKYYHDLAAEFSKQPFEEVMEKSRALVKEYYSCYPFLLQIAVLWMNHFMLAGEKESQDNIQKDIIRLCGHICEHSRDVGVCNDALVLKAVIMLQLGNAQETIEILQPLNDVNGLKSQSDSVLVQAYQMLGDQKAADYYSQIMIYTHLLSLVGMSIAYMDLHLKEREVCLETIKRTGEVIRTYDLEHLHPNVTLQFYFECAVFYCVHGEKAKALEELERFVCGSIAFVKEGVLLREDSYFNRLGEWFEELALGPDAPRSAKLILEGAAQALQHPAFSILFEEKTYQRLKNVWKKARDNSMNLTEFLPFLIPLIIAEMVLLIVTLRHILTHEHYKRGSRALWIVVVIVGMEFIGPILYFLLGKEDA